MSTKNRSLLLKRALDSLRNQSYSDWELLVFDDSSTDDSKEVIIHYCSLDKRIKEFVKPKGINFNEVRQALMMDSPTEFVVALDDDDFWHWTFLDTVIEVFDSLKAKTMVYTDCLLVNEKGVISHEDTSKGFPYPDVLPSLTVFRTEMFKATGGWRLDIFTYKGVAIHGELNSYLELRKIEKPLHIPIPLAVIYRTSNSMGAGRELNAQGTLILIKRWINELRDRPRELATLYCRVGIHFAELEAPGYNYWFKEALQVDPLMPLAWGALFSSLLGTKMFNLLLNLYKLASNLKGKRIGKVEIDKNGLWIRPQVPKV